LLLCSIGAIEVTFPRYAPRIFLSMSDLRGKGRNSYTQYDSRKRRKSYHSIVVHVFLSLRQDCVPKERTYGEKFLFQRSHFDCKSRSLATMLKALPWEMPT
jgi:hypothetical protein